MKRIAVFGETYSENLGDGIIFDSIHRLILDGGADAIPIDLSGRDGWRENVAHGPVRQAGLVRNSGRFVLRKSRLLRRMYSAVLWYGGRRRRDASVWERAIAEADAVLIGGGQLLTNINFGFPPRVHEVVRLAKRHGKPVAIFGCGVGGDWGFFSKRLLSQIVDSAEYISVRDHNSADALRRVPIRSRVVVHPDVAFMSRVSNKEKSPTGAEVLGVNLQQAGHFRAFVPSLSEMTDEEYRSFWVRLIGGAVASGRNVRLLTNGDPGDYLEAQKVRQLLATSGVLVELGERPERPQQLVSQIAEVSALICTRMHAGIVAYSLGKKVVPISWDRKIEGVWGAAGLGNIVVSPDILLVRDPWPKFEELIQSSAGGADHTRSLAGQVREAARNCLEILLAPDGGQDCG